MQLSARAAAIAVAAGMAGGALMVAYRANLLTANHAGSGAEGGDEEEAGGVGPLDAIKNSLGNLVSNPTSLSDAGLAALKDEEKFSATAYQDAGGYSIGFGHFIKAGEESLLGSTLTAEEGAELLAGDVAWAERAVASAVSAALTQEQFDALVSLAYNIGEGAFKKSTLVKLLNALDYHGAAAQFDRWNRSQGAVSQALVQRRARERQAFEGGIAV